MITYRHITTHDPEYQQEKDLRNRVLRMAVEESYRGRGIGTELIKQAEHDVRARNIHTVTLHARVTAKGFYEGLGYTATPGFFTEVTIPHIAMEKKLTH
jgi:predicted GNAT family N-acyltransferase